MAHRFPAIQQLLQRVDDLDLTVDKTTPSWHWLSTELEFPSNLRFKVILHQPLRQQRTLSEGSPYLFPRMRKYPLDHHATFFILIAHYSIPSKIASSPSNRSVQNAP